LRGEFAAQQPSLKVNAADGLPDMMYTEEFIELIDVLEAHLRAIFFDANNDKLEYDVYTDILSGGFSVMRVFTEYVSEMSLEQVIKVDRPFSVTHTGFDPMARDSHKGDGKYCFEIYPMTRESFEEQFGKDATVNMKFTRNIGEFSWSFEANGKEVVLVCDFYEKKRTKCKIIKLSNGATVSEKRYKEFVQNWEASGEIAQPPLPTGEGRTTYITNIVRYRFCETGMLDHTETNYKFLPLVFIDGNSIQLEENGQQTQMTRPYVYHAKGIQKLKNFAGQTLANELENLVQHKFVVAVESIPSTGKEAYKNVQKADVLTYHHLLDNDPDVQLPPPQPIQRTPIPPVIGETFRLSDDITQTILGSFDNAQGNVNQANAISGKAVQLGTLQSNAASVPYIVGYLKGLNRVAEIIIDLIPKYYRTPRTIPILLKNGERKYYNVNRKEGLSIKDYDSTAFAVKVEAGVNFAMQKQIAMQTIQQLMGASEVFAQFMNEKGLDVLLDNIEIRGIEHLKLEAKEWQEEKAKQMQGQEQMQQEMQSLEMQRAQREMQAPTQGEIESMKLQEKAAMDGANIEIKQRDSDTKFLQVMNTVRNSEIENALRAEEIDAENMRSEVELAISTSAHVADLAQMKSEKTEKKQKSE
jgi:hypothetical protein